jgi:hypothetical protein
MIPPGNEFLKTLLFKAIEMPKKPVEFQGKRRKEDDQKAESLPEWESFTHRSNKMIFTAPSDDSLWIFSGFYKGFKAYFPGC